MGWGAARTQRERVMREHLVSSCGQVWSEKLSFGFFERYYPRLLYELGLTETAYSKITESSQAAQDY